MRLRFFHCDRGPLAGVLLLLALLAAFPGPPACGATAVNSPTPAQALSGAAAGARSAAATAPAAAPTPVPLTEQQNIISFLGSAIGWYRQFSVETGLIEEPPEALYLAADQGIAEEVVKLAFDYADADAVLISKFGQSPKTAAVNPADSTAMVESRLARARTEADAAQAQVRDLNARLRGAPRRQRDGLARQVLAAQAQLELVQARVDFLSTMVEFEHTNTPAVQNGTLQAQIDELRRSVQAEAKKPLAGAAKEHNEPAGIVGVAGHLLDLRNKLSILDQRHDATQALLDLTLRTRAPLERALVSTDDSAQQLTRAALSNDRTDIDQRKKQFQELIRRRKLIGAALLPLTKQVMLLRRYNDNLVQWQNQVQRHTNEVLRTLLMHVGGILLVFLLIATLSLIWRRLAVRYVEDVNRRRQILKVRDATVVVLVILVLLFNFITELSALATVVGFAAAGIAVALQDVILSIAGYFRLSGRFGIKHGDRVELQGVRGEVVELGLTKLTLLELGGDGVQSGPTGRLVMIPNSSVFRDKFLNHPGHSLIVWRELRFTLSPDCDFRIVEKQLLEVVEAVFARYRDNARTQLLEMERHLNTRVDSGRPQSRVRLGPDGLQITLRFPVDVRSEAQVVDEISRRLLDFIAREPHLRFVPSGTPNIQPIAVVEAEGNHTAVSAPQENPLVRSQS
jgi:small-conductance mechanosensitive channel